MRTGCVQWAAKIVRCPYGPLLVNVSLTCDCCSQHHSRVTVAGALTLTSQMFSGSVLDMSWNSDADAILAVCSVDGQLFNNVLFLYVQQ